MGSRARGADIEVIVVHRGITADGAREPFGTSKARFAAGSEDRILIDDYSQYINAWNEAGGTGILHKFAEETRGRLIEMDILQRRGAFGMKNNARPCIIVSVWEGKNPSFSWELQRRSRRLWIMDEFARIAPDTLFRSFDLSTVGIMAARELSKGPGIRYQER